MRFPHAEDTDRLQAESQEARLRLIETELNLVSTWCSIAKTEARLGEDDRFQQSLHRINRAVASLRQHIHDPAHVPTELAPGFQEKLMALETMVQELKDTSREKPSGKK